MEYKSNLAFKAAFEANYDKAIYTLSSEILRYTISGGRIPRLTGYLSNNSTIEDKGKKLVSNAQYARIQWYDNKNHPAWYEKVANEFSAQLERAVAVTLFKGLIK